MLRLTSFLHRLTLYASVLALFFVSSLFAQWGPDVRLTFDDSLSYASNNNAWCVAAAPGGAVHAVWYDDRDGGYYEIYYKRSTTGGASWGTDVRLTALDLAESQYPAVCVAGSWVHVVWEDWRDGNAEIYTKRSTNGGASWEPDARLTFDANYSEKPSVSVAGTAVHVVWIDSRAGGGNYEIYTKRSTDGGVTWGSDIRLSNNSYGSWDPSVVVSGSVVHVVWRDDRDGPNFNGEIYYKRSTDGGVTWGPETRLTNEPIYESWYPSVAVSGPVVHVAWMDYRDGNSEVYTKRSTDGGVNWGPDARLTNNSSGTWQPSLSASGANVHVAWVDRRDGNWEIYYQRSTNSGVSWDPVDTRLTNEPNDSWGPSVAVADSVVHVVWYDYRDGPVGNREIYYKRNPTGNSGVEETGQRSMVQGQGYTAWPDPFSSFATVPGHERERFALYDISGRRVGSYRGDRIGEGLSPGVYFLRPEGEAGGPLRVVKLR